MICGICIQCSHQLFSWAVAMAKLLFVGLPACPGHRAFLMCLSGKHTLYTTNHIYIYRHTHMQYYLHKFALGVRPGTVNRQTPELWFRMVVHVASKFGSEVLVYYFGDKMYHKVNFTFFTSPGLCLHVSRGCLAATTL